LRSAWTERNNLRLVTYLLALPHRTVAALSTQGPTMSYQLKQLTSHD